MIGVDGYSRASSHRFLKCFTNNLASTALQCFINGCQEHGLPSRDKGVENADIARVSSGYYEDLFNFMHDDGILGCNDERDLYALHYVFLQPFKHHWMNLSVSGTTMHGLRTVNSIFPLAIWYSEVETGIDSVIANVSVYGIDPKGSVVNGI